MEWLDAAMTESRVPALGLLSIQRYYFFYRKQFLPYNFKWTLFCHFLEIIQLLALLIPKDSARALPWNYSLCGPIWTVLSFISLPDVLLQQLQIAPELVSALYAIVVGSKVITGIATAVLLGCMDSQRFAATVNESRANLLQRPLFLLNYLLNMLFRLLFIPIVAFWMSNFSSMQAAYHLSYIGLVLLAVGSRVVDTAYIGNTTWFQEDLESIAVCSDRIYLFLAKLLHVFICSAVNFKANSYYFSAGLMAAGLYSVLKVTFKAPFHDVKMNCLVLVKAEIALWGGVCLLLGNLDNSAQEMMKTTVLFFLLLPGFTVLLIAQLAKKLKNALRAEYPMPMYQVEHCVRLLLKTNDASMDSIDEVFRKAFLLYPSSPQLVVWSLYYYQYLKDVTFVQVSMSRLLKQSWGLTYFVECLYCVFVVEDWLHSLPDQAEVLSFMTFQHALKRATEADIEASRAHYELFTELAAKSPNQLRVTHLAANLGKQMKLCTLIYRQMLKSHPNSSEVLQRFSSFLGTLSSSKAAFKYHTLAQREISRVHAKRSDQSVDLYDPNCMVVVMSLEKASLGLITWAQNSELLGFSRQEVIGADHSAVVPAPIKATHIGKLKRITEFRHHHPVYESKHILYFANRQGFLVGAYWKVRLINMPGSGDMSIIAALKKRKDAPAIAFVGEDLSSVVAMVRFTQTKAFKKRIDTLLGGPSLSVFPLSDVFGPSHCQWEEGRVLCEQQTLGTERFLIKCEVISIFGVHRQEVLKLYYEMVATSQHKYSRPVIDHSESIIGEGERVIWTSNPDFMASELKASSLVEGPNRWISRKNTTVFESITGMGTTTLEVSDPPGFLKKVYREKKQALERARRALDWGILGVSALILAATLAMSLGNINFPQFEEQLDSLESMNTRRELVLTAALKAREPFLMSAGYFLNSTLTITQIIDLLHAQTAEMADKCDSDPEFRRIHYENKGVWWEFTPDGPVPLLRNAMEMVSLLASHALPLVDDWKCDVEDENFKAVYRNGPGGCLLALNQTLRSVLSRNFDASKDLKAHLLSQLLASLLGLGAALVLVLGFTLRKVNILHKSISVLLRRLPASIYALGKSCSRDRLVEFHDADASDIDLDFNSSTSKVRRRLCGDSVQLISSALVLLLVLVGGLVSLFALLHQQVSIYEIELPEKVEISGLRRLALIASLFYMRESQITADNYAKVFPTVQAFPCMSEEAIKQADMVHYYEANIMLSDLTATHLSSEMLTFSFDKAGEGFLKYGVHGALMLICSELPLFTLRNEVGKAEFAELEKHVSETLAALDVLTKEYSAVGKSELRNQSQFLWATSVITVISFFGGYSLLLRREVRSKAKRAKDLWRVLLFLPRQTALELCKLLK